LEKAVPVERAQYIDATRQRVTGPSVPTRGDQLAVPICRSRQCLRERTWLVAELPGGLARVVAPVVGHDAQPLPGPGDPVPTATGSLEVPPGPLRRQHDDRAGHPGESLRAPDDLDPPEIHAAKQVALTRPAMVRRGEVLCRDNFDVVEVVPG